MAMKQSHLTKISNDLIHNFDILINELEIPPLSMASHKYYGPCPIHGGDNSTAFNIYYDGHTQIGNWKCRTHLCEATFRASPIGFVRGVLSHKTYNWTKHGDKTVTFNYALNWCINFLNNKQTRIKKANKPKPKKSYKTIHISDDIIHQSLNIPSPYFIKRGYDHNILRNLNIGDCYNPNKYMFERAVVPIYNENKQFAGCIGRSIWDECDICKTYHNPDNPCPMVGYEWKFSKWLNIKFPLSNFLYNHWKAKEAVAESGRLFIVEGVGNALKLLENNIREVVAVFGNNITGPQAEKLKMLSPRTIIGLPDNDTGGKILTQFIHNKCSLWCNDIRFPSFPQNDISDLSNIELYEYILRH